MCVCVVVVVVYFFVIRCCCRHLLKSSFNRGWPLNGWSLNRGYLAIKYKNHSNCYVTDVNLFISAINTNLGPNQCAGVYEGL